VRTIAPFGTPDDGDTTVDRVARVAAGSGRSLPPSTTTGSNPRLDAPAGSDPVVAPSRRGTVPLHPGSGSSAGPSGSSAGGSGPQPAGASGLPDASGDAPPPASSARLNIHGGTSVAWGETQVDRPMTAPPGRHRWRWPLVAAGASLFVVLAGAGTGAFVYAKRGTAAAHPVVPTAPPPPTPMTLPSSRKDLPPVANGTALPVVATAVDTPTALPSTRIPTVDGKPHAGDAKTAAVRPKPPATTASAAPPTTQKPADDLSNIGRR